MRPFLLGAAIAGSTALIVVLAAVAECLALAFEDDPDDMED